MSSASDVNVGLPQSWMPQSLDVSLVFSSFTVPWGSTVDLQASGAVCALRTVKSASPGQAWVLSSGLIHMLIHTLHSDVSHVSQTERIQI